MACRTRNPSGLANTAIFSIETPDSTESFRANALAAETFVSYSAPHSSFNASSASLKAASSSARMLAATSERNFPAALPPWHDPSTYLAGHHSPQTPLQNQSHTRSPPAEKAGEDCRDPDRAVPHPLKNRRDWTGLEDSREADCPRDLPGAALSRRGLHLRCREWPLPSGTYCGIIYCIS